MHERRDHQQGAGAADDRADPAVDRLRAHHARDRRSDDEDAENGPVWALEIESERDVQRAQHGERIGEGKNQPLREHSVPLRQRRRSRVDRVSALFDGESGMTPGRRAIDGRNGRVRSFRAHFPYPVAAFHLQRTRTQ